MRKREKEMTSSERAEAARGGKRKRTRKRTMTMQLLWKEEQARVDSLTPGGDELAWLRTVDWRTDSGEGKPARKMKMTRMIDVVGRGGRICEGTCTHGRSASLDCDPHNCTRCSARETSAAARTMKTSAVGVSDVLLKVTMMGWALLGTHAMKVEVDPKVTTALMLLVLQMMEARKGAEEGLFGGRSGLTAHRMYTLSLRPRWCTPRRPLAATPPAAPPSSSPLSLALCRSGTFW